MPSVVKKERKEVLVGVENILLKLLVCDYTKNFEKLMKKILNVGTLRVIKYFHEIGAKKTFNVDAKEFSRI